MNNHTEMEQLLKERLLPAVIPDSLRQRLREAWRPVVAAAIAETPERRLRLRLHAWQWAFAAAAAVALVMGVCRLCLPPPAVPVPATGAPPPTWAADYPYPQPVTTPASQPDEVRQHILGADDLGLVGSPAANRARQVRVRYLETQRWQDPAGGGWIERSQPQEATLLIPIRELRDDGTGNIQAGPVHIIRTTP